MLTNLPESDADALTVAEVYRKRWTIETVFQEVTATLQCEIQTLGYPKAALFAFCLALVAFNAVSLLKAALRSVHGAATVNETVSGYYLNLEIRGPALALARGLQAEFNDGFLDRDSEDVRPGFGHAPLDVFPDASHLVGGEIAADAFVGESVGVCTNQVEEADVVGGRGCCTHRFERKEVKGLFRVRDRLGLESSAVPCSRRDSEL